MPEHGDKRSRFRGARGGVVPKMRRSCDACAVAKRRCDGSTCCSLCARKGIPCIYSKRLKSGPKAHHSSNSDLRVVHETDGRTKPPQSISAPPTAEPQRKKQQRGSGSGADVTVGWKKRKTLATAAACAPKVNLSLTTTCPAQKTGPAVAARFNSPLAKATPPFQKRKNVTKQQSRPIHQQTENIVSNAETVATAVVVSPGTPPVADGGCENGTTSLPPRLSLTSSKAAAAPATTVGRRVDFAPLPRPAQGVGVESIMLNSALTTPESSVEGSRSSPQSCSDVSDEVVSSLAGGVAVDCHDISDHEGQDVGVGAGTSLAGKVRFPVGGVLFGSSDPKRGSSKAGTGPMNGRPDVSLRSTTQLMNGSSRQPWHQPLQRQVSPVLRRRPCSPSVVYPRRQTISVEPGITYGDIGRQDSFQTDDDPILTDIPAVETTSSPISTWTPDDLEAGASALVAVFADSDSCVTAPDCRSNGGGHRAGGGRACGSGFGGVGLHQHRAVGNAGSSGNNNDDDDWLSSPVWLPKKSPNIGSLDTNDGMGSRQFLASASIRNVQLPDLRFLRRSDGIAW